MSPLLPSGDSNGKHIYHEILLSLPPHERQMLSANLELVRLKTHQVLHEPGDTLESAYFCNTGMISILSVFEDGKSVEVGLVGKEGFVGLPLVVGFRTAHTRAIAQIEGSAFRVDGEMLMAALLQSPKLKQQLPRYSQIMTLQVAQIAACNRLHEVEERLARWLSMCADRVGTNLVPLPQEFLAPMLGNRRSSVTVAAGILQRAGLISHTRGEVQIIIDRPLLVEACWECYENMQQQIKKWQGDAK